MRDICGCISMGMLLWALSAELQVLDPPTAIASPTYTRPRILPPRSGKSILGGDEQSLIICGDWTKCCKSSLAGATSLPASFKRVADVHAQGGWGNSSVALKHNAFVSPGHTRHTSDGVCGWEAHVSRRRQPRITSPPARVKGVGALPVPPCTSHPPTGQERKEAGRRRGGKRGREL